MGLGVGVVLVIVIVVIYLIWGVGSLMVGVVVKSVIGVVVNFVVSVVVINVVISMVNNCGNFGVVVKDVIFSDSLKGYVVVGISGGFMFSSLGV